MTPRAIKVRTAMDELEAVGIQPSVGKVQAQLGEPVTHDMNGRDVAVFREHMMELGYVLRPQGFNERWTKLEGMKLDVVKAFTEYATERDEQIKDAVEAYCTPENLRQVIDRAVQQSMDTIIREEVDRFYRYGKGRETVRKALEETIAAGREGL